MTLQHAEAAATSNELVWLRSDLQWPRQRLAALGGEDQKYGEDKR